jgi:hypothetical protein
MTLKHIAPILIITLLLAACGGAGASPTAVITELPSSTQTSAPISYPAPVEQTPVPTISIYPAPGTPGTGNPVIPLSGYEPQPGDENLKRDQVSLDLENSQLVITASDPAQAMATLNGNLTDPCHFLRVVVTPPGTTEAIDIEVYSLVDPNTTCIAQLEPFSASIPLGSYASGVYTVMVNGERLGQFDTIFAPQSTDSKLTRGEVFLDAESSRLIISGTKPNQVSVSLVGNLPDPCHQLRIVLTPADANNNINLEVYSLADNSPSASCITVLQPFTVIYPLGNFTSGNYSVYVNGELLGEFRNNP